VFNNYPGGGGALGCLAGYPWGPLDPLRSCSAQPLKINPTKSGISCPWEAVGPRGAKGSLVVGTAPRGLAFRGWSCSTACVNSYQTLYCKRDAGFILTTCHSFQWPLSASGNCCRWCIACRQNTLCALLCVPGCTLAVINTSWLRTKLCTVAVTV
jgi:hypothetical protein